MLLHPTPEEDKMAFYHPTSSNQGDILPTPYIWEPKHASHHELPLLPGNMMMHLNQASSSGSYLEFLSGSSMSSHSCVEVPSLDGTNEVVYTTPTSEGRSLQSIIGHLNNATGNPITNSAQGDAMMVSRTQRGIMDGGQNSQRQGLSLSLCTQTTSAVPALSSQHQYSNLGITSFSSNHFPISEEGTISLKGDHSSQNKELRNVEYLSFDFPENNHDVFKTEALLSRQCSVNPSRTHSDRYPSDKSGLENSTYLKAAQQLLDEIVNVRMAWKKPDKHQSNHGTDRDISSETEGGYGSFSNNGLSSVQHDTISSGDLSPAERQDLQKKKTQLLSMLDEVDKRYKQYYHQMEIIISSFDFIAGSGSAKRYTELARRTISCHFRCLRDSITCQIQATQRSLGEQDTIPIQGGIPRLRYVDHHLKQQRSIQQLGVMRHSWRPQRGLPESSVSILRAWLFEHFLNPYPKDSEKIMLARQTGLTRSQVANWFINARVRLWKPMVEEMHKEEFGDSDVNSCSFPENTSKAPKDNTLTPEDTGVELQGSLTSLAAGTGHTGLINESKFDVMPHVEINGPTVRVGSQHCPHRDDTSELGVMTSKDNKRSNVELCSLYLDEFASADQNGDRSIAAAAAAYRMSELGDFTVDSQVSLALELRHHEADVLTMCDGNRNRSDDVEASSPGPEMVDYHFTDSGNQRHKLDKPLWTHDFVV